MKMAKASNADLDMAMDLTSALESLSQRWGPTFPQEVAKIEAGEDAESFCNTDPEHCVRAMDHILELLGRGSLMRVVYNAVVMLDPRNKMVDPDRDTLEHHPDRDRGVAQWSAPSQKSPEVGEQVAFIPKEGETLPGPRARVLVGTYQPDDSSAPFIAGGAKFAAMLWRPFSMPTPEELALAAAAGANP